MVDAARLHWIFSVPVGIAICLIGIIGNLISICVWHRIMKSKRGSNNATSIYLIVLGLVDTGLLFFFLITDTIPTNVPSVKATFSFAAFYSYFGYPIFFFFIVASIWLMIGVTATRFIMVKFPLKARDWCSPRRAYIGIATTLIGGFIINIPHFFNYHPVKVGSEYELQMTKYGRSEYAQMYEFWVHCMFLVLAPWATIAILNACIIHSMLTRTKYMQKLDKTSSSKQARNKHDVQMTRVLLTVTFTFLFLLALQCITQCFYMLGQGKKKENVAWNQHAVDIAFSLAKMGVVINSAINCFLYCLTGSLFRSELKRLLPSGNTRYLPYSTTGASRSSRAATENVYMESQA